MSLINTVLVGMALLSLNWRLVDIFSADLVTNLAATENCGVLFPTDGGNPGRSPLSYLPKGFLVFPLVLPAVSSTVPSLAKAGSTTGCGRMWRQRQGASANVPAYFLKFVKSVETFTTTYVAAGKGWANFRCFILYNFIIILSSLGVSPWGINSLISIYNNTS